MQKNRYLDNKGKEGTSIARAKHLWRARVSLWGICLGVFLIFGLACWYFLIPWSEALKFKGPTPYFSKILLTLLFSYQIMSVFGDLVFKRSIKPKHEPSRLFMGFSRIFKLEPEQYRDLVKGLINPLFVLPGLLISFGVFIYFGVGGD